MAITKNVGHRKGGWKTYAFTFTFKGKPENAQLAYFEGRSAREAQRRFNKEYGVKIDIWDIKVV